MTTKTAIVTARLVIILAACFAMLALKRNWQSLNESESEKETKMATVKVFEINDCEWMAGEDLESVIQDYFKNYAMCEDTLENREEYCPEPMELSDETMERLKYHDIEGDLVGDGEKKVYTFREALNLMLAKGMKAPFYFASTEY